MYRAGKSSNLLQRAVKFNASSAQGMYRPNKWFLSSSNSTEIANKV